MQPLLGREREVALLDDLLDHVNERGAALVVRGAPGVGKSSLLAVASARARASGMLVLTATGVQCEAHLPFAGLHQLLRPILSEAAALPDPQRRALLAAFGMARAADVAAPTPAPDLFLIALAALDLLAGASVRAPLVLIAEDAHWLDRTTCDVLAFVARRLELDPLLLLIAIRAGAASAFDDAALPEMRLEGLDAPAAGALLDAHAPDLAAPVRERLLDEAEGNPLALAELPTALRAEERGGGEPLPPYLPLTARLERAFGSRASELPAATRTLLLVAAVDDGGILAEILGAAAALDTAAGSEEALEPALEAGLVALEDIHLRFRHPLVRSAICQAAGPARRRAAHAALAGALAGQADRRAWHRAASVVGPDEAAAAELEAAATRAEHRGALAVSVAALERAAQLTDEPTRRADRLLRAADLAFGLGRRDLGQRLLRDVAPLELGPRERTRLQWIREVFGEDSLWSGATKVRAFVEMADRARQEGDDVRAWQSLLMIALRCYWSNPDKQTRDLVVAAAERIPAPEDDPTRIAVLALAAPIERGAYVLGRMALLPPDGAGNPTTAYLLGGAAVAVGDFARSASLFATAIAALRAQGQLGLLAQALEFQARAAIYLGTWKVAMPAAEEAGRLARETQQPRWVAVSQTAEAMLAALRGEFTLSESLAAGAERALLAAGANPLLALVQLARGATALGGGRFADAFEHLRRVFDPADSAYHPYIRVWAVGDLVEAAVHSGHRDEARAILGELEPLAATTRSPILLAGICYARPLLAEDEQAEALFAAGLGTPGLTTWPFIRARLQLAHGTWLRRQRRVAESRAPLRAAREAFDALGAIPWGERARQELRASGETSRHRAPGAVDQLSPQELQIAQLAANGLSNREIGQRLYLSHRTVGFHLYRIFPRLGITSRSELRAALGGEIAS